MNSKIENFADRAFDYSVERVGLAHTRLLVVGIVATYVLGVMTIIRWLWVTHGPVIAIVSVVLGLTLHCATSLWQRRQSVLREMEEDYPQHHTDAALRPAEYLLYFCLPKKVRNDVLGDLQEEYLEICGRLSRQKAKWWVHKQVVTSLWLMLQTMGWKLVSRNLAKWGLIGWLEEVIRRIAH